jgi:PhzF family phenazine biosynthesis protein
MKLTIFQVDAFAENTFSGNPAAVVPLENWLPDETMQNIAMENNLSETAFFIPSKNGFHLRWFTPVSEVNLCGHATLATSHVLFNHLDYYKPEIIFQSKSGTLKVSKKGNLIELDFPASEIEEISMKEYAGKLFGILPQKCYKGREDLCIYFGRRKK